MQFRIKPTDADQNSSTDVAVSPRQKGQAPQEKETGNILNTASNVVKKAWELTEQPVVDNFDQMSFPERLVAGAETSFEANIQQPARAAVNGVKDFVSSTNKTGLSLNTRMADLIGAPVDMVGTFLNTTGLTDFENIDTPAKLKEFGNRLGVTYGPEDNPEGFEARLGNITADGLVFTGGLLLPGKNIYNASKLLNVGSQKGFNTLSTLARDVYRSFTTSPSKFTAAEGAGIFASAVGADVLTDMFPESEYAEAFGELLGPLSLESAIQGAKFISRTSSRVTYPFTEAARQDELSRVVDAELTPRAREDFERMRGLGISPARSTGQRNLISMENYLRNRNSELDRYLSDNQLKANARLEEQLRRVPGNNSSERLINMLTDKRGALLASIDRLAVDAAADLARNTSSFTNVTDSLTLNQSARNTIDTYYSQGLAQQKEAWSVLDDTALTNLDETRQVIASETASRSKAADPSDIPNYVITLTKPRTAEDVESIIELSPAQKQQLARLEETNSIDARYVQDLRSRVLQDIRAERAKDAPNRNKIRFLGSVQEALLNDLRKAEGQSEAVDGAIAYSRAFNEKFHRGSVGRILGFNITGEAQTPVERTIDTVLSGNTVQEVQRAISAAPEIKPLVADHLRSRFAASVVNENGSLKQGPYRTFMNRYENVLTEFPTLRTELESAKEANRVNTRISQRAEFLRNNLTNPNKSVATAYIENPDAAINDVLTSNSPAKEAIKLRNLAENQDADYISALSSGLIENLIKRSTRELDDGSIITNGRKLSNNIDRYKSVAKVFGMTERDIQELKRISEALYRNNMKVSQEISPQGEPSTFIDFYARLRGNVLGGKIFDAMNPSGQSAGMGSLPVRAATTQIFRNFAARMQAIPLEKLATKMVQDRDLFEQMFRRVPDTPEKAQEAIDKIYAFFPGVFSDNDSDSEKPSETYRFNIKAAE